MAEGEGRRPGAPRVQRDDQRVGQDVGDDRGDGAQRRALRGPVAPDVPVALHGAGARRRHRDDPGRQGGRRHRARARGQHAGGEPEEGGEEDADPGRGKELGPRRRLDGRAQGEHAPAQHRQRQSQQRLAGMDASGDGVAIAPCDRRRGREERHRGDGDVRRPQLRPRDRDRRREVQGRLLDEPPQDADRVEIEAERRELVRARRGEEHAGDGQQPGEEDHRLPKRHEAPAQAAIPGRDGCGPQERGGREEQGQHALVRSSGAEGEDGRRGEERNRSPPPCLEQQACRGQHHERDAAVGDGLDGVEAEEVARGPGGGKDPGQERRHRPGRGPGARTTARRGRRSATGRRRAARERPPGGAGTGTARGGPTPAPAAAPRTGCSPARPTSAARSATRRSRRS